MTTPREEAIEVMERGEKEPAWWIESVLGCTLTAQERELADKVAKHTRTTVRSCTASGKTWTAARLALWFLLTHQPSVVLTTAKTFRQVEIEIWKEIWIAYGKARYPLGGRLLATKLEMDKEWFALGFSTDDAENVLGVHAPYIFIIIDEAPGIPNEVYNAIETPMSTGHAKLLLLGNPLQPIGAYRDTFESDLYEPFIISAFDTPNFLLFDIKLDDLRTGYWKEKMGVAEWQIEDGSWIDKLPCPYLITPLWAAQRLEAWGEGSLSFQVYVMGNFPEKGVNNLFVLEEVEAAINRKVMDEGEKVSAADIARYGDCKSVYGVRRGERVIRIDEWGHQGIHYTPGRLARHYREDETSIIHIDAGGFGVDDCDLLEKEGIRVNRVLSNDPAIDNEMFGNRRAELYFMLSKRFHAGKISIPDDKELVSQLCDIRIRDYTTRGAMYLESKENMRARGSRSPDKADMLAMLFYPEAVNDAAPEPWAW